MRISVLILGFEGLSDRRRAYVWTEALIQCGYPASLTL